MSLKPLPDGAYSVSWYALSTADGHPNQGKFTFRFGQARLPGSAATTEGARPSVDAVALRWQDIDLAKGELSVRRNMVELGSKLVFQEPKTSAGRRSVKLSPSIVLALKEHRTAQLERRLFVGYWREPNLVFTTADGGPIAPRNLIRHFKELIVRADVPKIRFHDLRHCHATLLLQEGLPAKIVSERLGHASIAITLDTYSHVLPNMQEQAADGIERALFGA